MYAMKNIWHKYMIIGQVFIQNVKQNQILIWCYVWYIFVASHPKVIWVE